MNVSEELIREIVTKVLEESAGKGSKPEFEKHIDPSGIIGIKTSTVKCEPFQQDGVKLKDVVTLEEAPVWAAASWSWITPASSGP